METTTYRTIEAESFDLEAGFEVVSSTAASGDAWVQHKGGATATMSTTILDQAGTYDLVINYFDENDGNAFASVAIDDEVVGSWTWSEDFGSAYADGLTQTSYVIENVTLDDISKLTITGARDGGEPLRIDSVELRAASSEGSPPVQTTSTTTGGTTSTGGSTGSSGGSSGSSGPLLAFEGAQGFGAETAGGRGGEIVKVTNLNDSGVGSLRWALEDLSGPRIVVFEVGGVIDLSDQIEINGQVTVAGQTAPGGITITGARLRVVESDVIIRGLNIRPGDGDGDNPENRDGLSVGKSGHVVENVIIDHNSFSWSVDELVATWGAPSNVTFSNNIFAEALKSSIHPEGNHSMGMLIGDGSSRITVVGNLFAHNQFRNATVKDDSTEIEFVNNVIYNYGPNGFLSHEGNTIHVIGNTYIAGVDSADRAPIRLESPESGTAFYVSGNDGDVSGAALSKISGSYVFDPSNVTTMSSSEALVYVLANAGARSPELGAIDARIIQSVIDGTGSIIDSPSDVGGYGQIQGSSPLPDSDNDGIPDAFEAIIGSNASTFDAHGDANGDGYSNIENYINGLIDGFDEVISPQVDPGPDEPVVPQGPEAPQDPTAPEEGGSYDTGPIRVEAENMNLSSKFRVDSNGHASGDKFIVARGNGLHSADFIFDGPSGVYDIVIEYFDENDGESSLSVSVDGEVIDQWLWDEGTESAYADSESATTRILHDVEIDTGDSVVLAGYRDGREPLRIDAVELLADSLLG